MTAKTMQKANGLTLVELIISIVLMSVLAVFIAPKFLNTSSDQSYLLRKEIIAKLRKLQFQSMNNVDRCYMLSINNQGYQSQSSARNQNNQQCIDNNVLYGEFIDFPKNTSITLIGNAANPSNNNLSAFKLSFDVLGRVLQCNQRRCLQVNGINNVLIMVEKEGFIYAE